MDNLFFKVTLKNDIGKKETKIIAASNSYEELKSSIINCFNMDYVKFSELKCYYVDKEEDKTVIDSEEQHKFALDFIREMMDTNPDYTFKIYLCKEIPKHLSEPSEIQSSKMFDNNIDNNVNINISPDKDKFTNTNTNTNINSNLLNNLEPYESYIDYEKFKNINNNNNANNDANNDQTNNLDKKLDEIFIDRADKIEYQEPGNNHLNDINNDVFESTIDLLPPYNSEINPKNEGNRYDDYFNHPDLKIDNNLLIDINDLKLNNAMSSEYADNNIDTTEYDILNKQEEELNRKNMLIQQELEILRNKEKEEKKMQIFKNIMTSRVLKKENIHKNPEPSEKHIPRSVFQNNAIEKSSEHEYFGNCNFQNNSCNNNNKINNNFINETIEFIEKDLQSFKKSLFGQMVIIAEKNIDFFKTQLISELVNQSNFKIEEYNKHLVNTLKAKIVNIVNENPILYNQQFPNVNSNNFNSYPQNNNQNNQVSYNEISNNHILRNNPNSLINNNQDNSQNNDNNEHHIEVSRNPLDTQYFENYNHFKIHANQIKVEKKTNNLGKIKSKISFTYLGMYPLNPQQISVSNSVLLFNSHKQNITSNYKIQISFPDFSILTTNSNAEADLEITSNPDKVEKISQLIFRIDMKNLNTGKSSKTFEAEIGVSFIEAYKYSDLLEVFKTEVLNIGLDASDEEKLKKALLEAEGNKEQALNYLLD